MTEEELKNKISLVQQILDLMRRILHLQTQLEKMKIEEMITRVAKEYRVDEELALRVAKCESNFNPKATNKRGNYPSYSVDRGLYMWNDYWHPEISDECAFSAECATREFCKAVKTGHLSWWNASSKCWKKV